MLSPVALLTAWSRLRRDGFQHTLKHLQTHAEAGSSPSKQVAMAKETAFALAVGIKAGPWWPKCLTRSVALGWLLAKRGIPFEIRIGVLLNKGDKAGFAAHAWVEHAGVVLNDRQDIAADFSTFEAGSDPL